MKNYDDWKKSQITDISTFCYWLHQKGVGIYVLVETQDIFFDRIIKIENWIQINLFKFPHHRLLIKEKKPKKNIIFRSPSRQSSKCIFEFTGLNQIF